MDFLKANRMLETMMKRTEQPAPARMPISLESPERMPI